MRDEGLRKVEVEREERPELLARSPATDPAERIAELMRALAATREREADFRQAAFDLNAELLRKDAELETFRERLDVAEPQVVELPAIRNRLSELEGLTQTRAFRAASFWWRVKAIVRPR